MPGSNHQIIHSIRYRHKVGELFERQLHDIKETRMV